MAYKIEYGCVNIKGGVRAANQDNFYVQGRFRAAQEKFNDISLFGTASSDENAIFAVYDGMGGEACGDVASLIAAQGTLNYDRLPGDGAQILGDLCRSLNAAVCDFSRKNGVGTMGSTAAILRFSPAGVHICNLGDSRIYRLQGGELMQLSLDHSAKDYYRKKAPLTQFLGIPTEEIAIMPYIVGETYVPGVCYLACSDGITDMLTNDEIAAVISAADSVKKAVLHLVSAALKRGGMDNITAILCRIVA